MDKLAQDGAQLKDESDRWDSEEKEDLPWGWTQSASSDPMPFDPAGFPKSFFKRLLPRLRNGVMVFPVYVWEDPDTRERVFLNANRVGIAAFPPERDYDPTWWLDALYGDKADLGWSPAEWLRLGKMFDSSQMMRLPRIMAEGPGFYHCIRCFSGINLILALCARTERVSRHEKQMKP